MAIITGSSMTSRLLRYPPIKLAVLFGTGMGYAALALLSWLPAAHRPHISVMSDKLEHAFAYLLLGALTAIAVREALKANRLALAIVAYAGILELGQLLIPDRVASVADFFASAAGATVGVSIVALTVSGWRCDAPATRAPMADVSHSEFRTGLRGQRNIAVFKFCAFLVVMLAISLTISGAEATKWYVATDGSDDADGTSSDPFQTWQRAFYRSRRGDTILIAPGVYRPARLAYGARIKNKQDLTIIGHGGTPILDCTDVRYKYGINCFRIEDSRNIRVVGIEVRNTAQLRDQTWPNGIHVYNVQGGSLENVNSHHHEGSGIYVGGNTSNFKILNSDAHHNYQPFPNNDRPGGDSDGIGMGVNGGNDGNSIVGCRTWANGDDGIDLWNGESKVVLENNWSWGNGVAPDPNNQDGSPAGNGVGFKLGRNSSAPKHWVARNLAWKNKNAGFDTNGAGALNLVNNTAWDNKYNFIVSGAAHWLRNNLSVDAPDSLGGPSDVDANSWDVGGATAADFASTDASGTAGQRKSDGTLPELPFLKLANSSDMIDAGVDVGHKFIGAAPDIGAYEFDGELPPNPGCPAQLREAC